MAGQRLSRDGLQALARQRIHDRVLGCLFGAALGDAIGLYTEFLSADIAAACYPSRSFTLAPSSKATAFRRDAHRNPHQPGEWTDDTDHALLIVLSYLHANGAAVDPRDFASRLHVWVRQGLRALDTLPMGLGRTVGSIVRNKDFLQDPEGTARHHWIVCSHRAAPNGSLMRTHPLGVICLDKTIEDTFQLAADFSVITHVDPRCIVSCAIGTALIRGILRHDVYAEAHIDGIIDAAIEWYAGYRERQIAQSPSRAEEPDLDLEELKRHTTVRQLADLRLDEARKIGYVYKTLGAGIHTLRLAMRVLHSTGGAMSSQLGLFESLITDLVMEAGDADTNAGFAGALLGSLLGFGVLPRHWRDGLRHGVWLLDKAEGLGALLGVGNVSYDGLEDKDTAPDGGRGFLTDKQIDTKVMKLQAWMVQEERKKTDLESRTKKRDSHWLGWPWK
ncbi:hypothetical protein HIM_08304 [Hirsutella minnesotensis 3608]|uniref:ADP-ribosylglycohydrolase n=1 Tax=Hirsutella minnesotensis 3608 TaxID=1043627 RepID=A0A0F7ZT03_9HYPO|nr:hypothetical protein HIM_08304 [Hirsutella minnesotensis 3608]